MSVNDTVEKSTIIGEPIRRAKTNVQKILKESTGLMLDQVAGANDKTGTSNDGNQARRFFKWETCDVIVNLVEDKYKETVACLHKNLSDFESDFLYRGSKLHKIRRNNKRN